VSRTEQLRPVEEQAPDQALHRILRLSRETLTEESWPAREGELRRLQDRLGANRPRVRWGLVTAMSALAVLLPAVGLLLKEPSALTFEVIHGTVAAGGEIRPLDSGTRIQFSDGSQVVLDDGARTQVRDLAADGARIVLTHGRAHTYFVPRPHAHWLVAAGPYEVQVTGTIFDVEWSEENQALDVWLHKGSVTVRGPLIDGGVVMTHGQHLLMRIRDNKIVLDKNAGETAAARPSGHGGSGELAAADEDEVDQELDAPEEPAASAAGGTTAVAPSRRGGMLEHGWSRHLARGDFEAVVTAAEKRGIDNVLARGSRRELGALADASRYTRRGSLARRVLRAEQARFPDSTEGREAAYFLGNLAEDDGAPHKAISWFERYRRENPAGTYASQALGHSMMIHARDRSSDAETDAREYLRRYPNGSYAEAARHIIKPQ
jgi:ferric-dicitrate binding protein FerR (iron transport regulator)/TolA-binding protein